MGSGETAPRFRLRGLTMSCALVLERMNQFTEASEMRRVIPTLGAAFFLATQCMAAFANIVPGAVLHLDARNNPNHPDAWTSIAEAGGHVPPMDAPPALEEGPIKIPDIGIDEPKAKYYTSRKRAEMYGTKGFAPPLALEDWTIELLVRRNGDMFHDEHQLAGVNAVWARQQGIRFGLDAANNLKMVIYEAGVDKPVSSNIILEEGVWNWVAFTGRDKEEILAYHNGREVNKRPGVDLQRNVQMRTITIGASTPSEKVRNFNGSIALFRVYDKVLRENEIMQNINAWSGLAVDPGAKLATTWGSLKASH